MTHRPLPALPALLSFLLLGTTPAIAINAGTSGLDHAGVAVATGVSVDLCGDGDVTGDEQCDDGDTENGDGCSEECRTEVAVDKRQARCILKQNKAGVAVASAQEKLAASCLKAASLNTVDDADACAADDAKGSVGTAISKGIAGAAKLCADRPPWGFVDAESAMPEAAARSLVTIAQEIFDSIEGNAVLKVASQEDAACQSNFVKGTLGVLKAERRAFLACKKDGLLGKNGAPFVSAVDLATCLDAVAADADGRIDKARTKLTELIQKDCRDYPLVNIVGSRCDFALRPSGLINCLSRIARCNTCRLFRSLDGFSADCDLFDDNNGTNASCLF
jgi:cysteine-rich repeat protein